MAENIAIHSELSLCYADLSSTVQEAQNRQLKVLHVEVE
jgi:hypothetical protein